MNLDKLLNIMSSLRGEKGCPWDREQTKETLKPFIIEEAYEVLEAIDENNPDALKEELGDLLFQIIFQCQIADENGEFSMSDVVDKICRKMIARHPHVFGDADYMTSEEVLVHWEEQKKKEGKKRESVMDGIPKNLPSLMHAHSLQDRVSRIGFDWKNRDEVMVKLDEEMKEKIGYLPEDRGLYPKMKVGELLIFLAELKGLSGQMARNQIDHWLKRFDLTDWKLKKVEELSRGMQQKVQFIATVVHEPELIILDEPFSGLDPVNTKLLKDIMLEMKADGKTIIFSTHRMEQVEMVCDNICLINKAERVLEGSLNQIKQQYGKNTILLDYEGDAGFIKGFDEISKIDDYGKYMEIKLKEQVDPQLLLNRIVGKIRVNKFEVREPTLNAIFIEKVGVQDEENSVSH